MLSAIDILGAAIGLVYIVSEYRASRWFWPSSLLMSAFYLVIDLQARGRKADAPDRPITSCPRRLWPLLAGVVALLTVLLWWLLRLTGESQLPWADGLSSALTIVGMWMLAHKWWQQWFCWLLVEPLMIFLFLRAGLYASALLYVVYTVFCILGLIRWRRLCTPAGTPS